MSVQQVYDSWKSLDPDTQLAITKLKAHFRKHGLATGYRALGQKVSKEISQKYGTNLNDSTAIGILDDWLDSLKRLPGKIWEAGKQFYSQNKQTINPMLMTLARTLGRSAFGGQITPEDANAIDVKYIMALYGGCPPQHRPRAQLHRLAFSTRTFQMPIKILGDGSTLIVVRPQFMANYLNAPIAPIGGFISTLPFIYQSGSNSTLPNASVPTDYFYFNQVNNVAQLISIDIVRAQIVLTQNALNLQGRLTMSHFDQAPNASWNFVPQTNGSGDYALTAASISITTSQLVQNTGQSTQIQLRDLPDRNTHYTYVPDVQTYLDVNATKPFQWQFSQQQLNAMPFSFFKFQGCTPTTTIGYIRFFVSVSFQPTAQQKGVFEISPRYSYQGTRRAFKYYNKKFGGLNYRSYGQMHPLMVQNYAEVHLDQTYGSGIPLQHAQLQTIYSSNRRGYCVGDSLDFMGIEHKVITPWATAREVLPLFKKHYLQDNLLLLTNDDNQYLTFDVKTKHAYVTALKTQYGALNCLYLLLLPFLDANGMIYLDEWYHVTESSMVTKDGQIYSFPVTISQMGQSFWKRLGQKTLYHFSRLQNNLHIQKSMYSIVSLQSIRQYLQSATPGYVTSQDGDYLTVHDGFVLIGNSKGFMSYISVPINIISKFGFIVDQNFNCVTTKQQPILAQQKPLSDTQWRRKMIEFFRKNKDKIQQGKYAQRVGNTYKIVEAQPKIGVTMSRLVEKYKNDKNSLQDKPKKQKLKKEKKQRDSKKAHIVPKQKPVANPKSIDRHQSFLQSFRDRIEKLSKFDKNRQKGQTVMKISFAAFLQIPLVGLLHRSNFADGLLRIGYRLVDDLHQYRDLLQQYLSYTSDHKLKLMIVGNIIVAQLGQFKVQVAAKRQAKGLTLKKYGLGADRHLWPKGFTGTDPQLNRIVQQKVDQKYGSQYQGYAQKKLLNDVQLNPGPTKQIKKSRKLKICLRCAVAMQIAMIALARAKQTGPLTCSDHQSSSSEQEGTEKQG